MTAMDLLIVDDNPANLMLMGRYAQAIPGVRVYTASSGLEGLAWCGEHNVDLVVTDFIMPGMDGMEFIRRLRALESIVEVPVVMVTNNGAGASARGPGQRRDGSSFQAHRPDRIHRPLRARTSHWWGESLPSPTCSTR
jgi:CheY-like chemotaxis protein